ncbi:patatin-like phospholipase family protein [Actinomadura soli]|uniref:Patatin-like phospholipase family protein n=1 Tax=Actinomadura soli TaxID=2508997 RepID=A0A5C4JAE1_9ACTN|nr:patatin-like phospholipase family protein [Actinomadura soli]TMQ98930.1 patatin-like phospholipase family protein [Actinomadura soli]
MTQSRESGGWALVLGPGGPVGTAWLAGLAAGLRRSGVDPAAATLIVGTSAGAIAGAMIMTGRELAEVAELPPEGRDRPPSDVSVLNRTFELTGAPGLDPDEVRRRIGRLALEAETQPEARHRAGMEYLVGTDEWPGRRAGRRRLLITAVDIESGKPVVWDGSDDGVPLTAAVAASSAAPGFAEPVTIGGRRYMDGAYGGGSNAHLAADAGAGAVVLIEPLPRAPDGSGADIWIVPDERAREAFGDDVGDMARWTPAYRAGLRQAPAAAALIGPAIRGLAG